MYCTLFVCVSFIFEGSFLSISLFMLLYTILISDRTVVRFTPFNFLTATYVYILEFAWLPNGDNKTPGSHFV